MKLPNIFERDTQPASFTTGSVIFEEGQARDVMYIVKSGEVDLFVRGELVETVAADGFFGEMALIDPAPRSATAIAKTDCLLYPLNERQFLFMIQETPFFSITMLRTLTTRLRKRNMQYAGKGA